MTKANHYQYLRHNANIRKRNTKQNRRTNIRVILFTIAIVTAIAIVTETLGLPVYM